MLYDITILLLAVFAILSSFFSFRFGYNLKRREEGEPVIERKNRKKAKYEIDEDYKAIMEYTGLPKE